MKDLQETSDTISDIKGSLIAMDALIPALLETLSPNGHETLVKSFEAHAVAARTVMLKTAISDQVLSAFERDIARTRSVLLGLAPPEAPQDPRPSAEEVLLTSTRVSTFIGPRPLTGASGFFFRRNGRLFLVTNRHVLADESTKHFPDRIEIELHTDTRDLTQCVIHSMPLYKGGLGLWREATDSGGAVDVAAIEIETDRLPGKLVLHAFDATHLDPRGEDVVVGDALTVIGFPLGFHDTVHHLAVARSASLASAYGVRFQQKGYFLTDARTHRGSSGAPVLRRRSGYSSGGSPHAWQLLGVHSTRMDMRSRNLVEDESLGLNCVWYADVLMTLTGDAKKASKP